MDTDPEPLPGGTKAEWILAQGTGSELQDS